MSSALLVVYTTTPDSEILTLDTKGGDATGVRIYESSHEGSSEEMQKAKSGQ